MAIAAVRFAINAEGLAGVILCFLFGRNHHVTTKFRVQMWNPHMAIRKLARDTYEAAAT